MGCSGRVCRVPLVCVGVVLTFAVSLLKVLMCHSRLVSSLLYLRKVVLSLFVVTALVALGARSLLTGVIPVTVLIFTTYRTTINLTLLISVSGACNLSCMRGLGLLRYWGWSSRRLCCCR